MLMLPDTPCKQPKSLRYIVAFYGYERASLAFCRLFFSFSQKQMIRLVSSGFCS
jgi:hypothetical protein